MPIKYQVSDDGRFVHAVASGTLNAKVSVKCQRLLAEDEKVKLGYRLLFDTTRIAKVKITKNDVDHISSIVYSNPKNSHAMKVAIIANTMIVFELSRLYEWLISRNKNICIFNNISSAREWLDVA